ncbi:MAG: TetR/AcrR family transcriptional regulator [Lachnospiraceae bacterium]|nr:TetR/AcrR family transcriptional regulator [Lachnospiraceae bacterium]
MKQKKTNNPLLKECFFTALVRLMDQKDFQEITISEIAEVAGVSRMTYYRTYDSKEDILLQYFDDRAKQFIAEIKQEPDITSEEFSIRLFRAFQSQAHFLKYLHQAGLITGILDHFTQFIRILYCEIGGITTCDPTLEYQIQFIAGGMYMLLLHWIESGQIETPEELAKISMSFLRDQSALRSDNASL